ncbi:NAD(P)H-dependent glycerol-3-phosphate dehydrogenase [Jannaschia ovalis]|uniref:Glycerol-3-phosphate dehydrogenase [NAD(P)+] n=1 Tax=Jannaschia ovalis TaxID=3038773 RepID=A0ABY8L8T9_9RHOB|nr:NAD(P)H-dependent glycerol-3-phosphate dehydrogenase [Jannaschia sp. GRR-S6-38]WGH77689.1 NAD(P)-dependent glycerol-3-phosphate dehydrogenase [Jannaschia sp. GRR-S6-38]
MSGPIGIVGAGAFGTALAFALGRAGAAVTLWGRDAMVMGDAARSRVLPRLPDAPLPAPVTPTADPAALSDCETVLLAVPMQTLTGVLAALALTPRHTVAACKGVDLATGRGPTALIAAAWPDTVPAILSGPSFAADIARGLPTALVLGCSDDAIGAALQTRLSTRALRLYRATDVAGVELGGAMKNVIAIACGAAIGAGLGDSARAALMTRGMAEMMRLAEALGARRETLMGLSGLGDLALTCASPQSRNFALGLAIGGAGEWPRETTEGVATARAALDLGRAHGVELPVTRATAGLVAGEITVKDAMEELLSRDLRRE